MTALFPIHYFAYGSNMDLAQMQQRCPGARVLGSAVLVGYRFGINARGYATVIPDPLQKVHGLVWMITPLHQMTLDHHESVPDHYTRQTMPIQWPQGDQHDMLIYVAVNASPGRPQPGYLEKIMAAAKHHRLPENYVQSMATWQS